MRNRIFVLKHGGSFPSAFLLWTRMVCNDPHFWWYIFLVWNVDGSLISAFALWNANSPCFILYEKHGSLVLIIIWFSLQDLLVNDWASPSSLIERMNYVYLLQQPFSVHFLIMSLSSLTPVLSQLQVALSNLRWFGSNTTTSI